MGERLNKVVSTALTGLVTVAVAGAALTGGIVYRDWYKRHSEVAAVGPPNGYAPTVLFYMNGQYITLKQIEPATPNKAECMEKLGADIAEATRGHVIPPGGSVLGACIPIPKAPPALLPHEQDELSGEATDTQTGADGSQKIRRL